LTIRELIISFGYEIDKKAEKKVNESIDGLKNFVSKALGTNEAGFKVSGQKQVESVINDLSETAETLAGNLVGFEVDGDSQRQVESVINDLSETAETLAENPIGFEVDEDSQRQVESVINDLNEMAETLAENPIGFEVDGDSQRQVESVISDLSETAETLAENPIGFEVDADSQRQVESVINDLSETAETLAENPVGFEVDADSQRQVESVINDLNEMAETLAENPIGFEVDADSQRQVESVINDLSETAENLAENLVGFEVDADSQRQVESVINDLNETAEALAENDVGFKVDRRSENEAVNAIKRIRSTALRLLGVIGIGFSLIQMARLSEEFGGINDKIRDATRELGDQHEIQQRILKAANDARLSYADMAAAVSQFTQNSTVFDNIEDAAGFATLLAQDFAGAAISQEKSAYLTRCLATDLQKGAMSSQALNTMLSDAPHMAIRLANSLNVTTYELQEMARRGEISADMLKSSFTNSAEDIAARFAETDMTISDALRNVRNGWGLFVAQMDDTLGISRMVARGIVTAFNRVLTILRRLVDGLMRVANALGGLRNLFRLLAIAAGAFMAVMAVGKIVAIVKAIRSMDKALLKAKVKMLAIVAVLVILGLITEDFLAFMRGDDSLLGHLLEKFGIDAEGVRETVLGLWEAIKGVIPFVTELAKTFGGMLLDAFKKILPVLMDLIRQILPPLIDFIKKLLPLIFQIIRRILPIIIDLIMRIVPIVLQIIGAILPVLIRLIETLLPIVMQIIELVLPIIIDLIEMFIAVVLPVIEKILPILMGLLESLMPVITFVAELLGNYLGAAFEGLMPIIEAFMTYLGGLIDFIAGVFTGDWTRAWEGIKSIFSGIISGLAAIFKLPVNLIITGLNTFIDGLNKIKIPNWVPGVGGKGINIPQIPMLAKGSDFSPDTFIAGEEGPELITNAKGSKVFTASETADTLGKLNALSNWEMPTFTPQIEPVVSELSLHYTGVAHNTPTDGGIAGFIKDMAKSMTMPVSEVAEVYNSHAENKTITQYNEFYNEFHGDRAGQQRSSEAMEAAQEDATGALARALAYVR